MAFNYNWFIIWIIIFIINEYIIYKTNGLQLMSCTVFLLSVHTPWGVWFLASIKCICIVEFCLSFLFYFIRQFFYCCVELCWILLDFVEHVYCIHYYFPNYFPCILHTLLFFHLKCIQYFFLYLLDKVHFICFTNFISNTYIPLFVNYKHIKNNFLFFFLTYGLKCAFLYTYFYPLVKH